MDQPKVHTSDCASSPFAQVVVACPHCNRDVEVDLTAGTRPLNRTSFLTTDAMIMLLRKVEHRLEEQWAHRHVLGVMRNKPDDGSRMFDHLLYAVLEPHGA